MFNQIISDLRKEIEYNKNNGFPNMGSEQNMLLQAKLDQTLLCEKIANELLSQKINSDTLHKASVIAYPSDSQQNKIDANGSNMGFQTSQVPLEETKQRETGSVDALIQEKQKHKDFVEKEITFLDNQINRKVEICIDNFYKEFTGKQLGTIQNLVDAISEQQKQFKELKAELESQSNDCQSPIGESEVKK
jgi:hypothetical protein